MLGPYRHQQTIAHPVAVQGFGFWSGRDARLEFRPAEANSGIVFIRHDLDPAIKVPAHISHRLESPRRTILGCRGVRVEMVEHVMAALAGLQIDNCEVWLDAAEVPGFDGSCLPFVEALRTTQLVRQDEPRAYIVVNDVTRVGDGDHWIEARPPKRGETGMRLTYRLDYGPESAIGRETLHATVSPAQFTKEIAPARTFILRQEAEWLRQQGLAKRVTPQDVLVFDEMGLIDNELRFDNECVRHKVLDVIGDFALAGCDIVGQFVAHRSGHRLNACLVQALLAESQLVNSRKVSA